MSGSNARRNKVGGSRRPMEIEKMPETHQSQGAAAARARTVAVEEEHPKPSMELVDATDGIDELIASESLDVSHVEPDDIFKKAVNGSAEEFRNTFHGRANSLRGVNWKQKR
jgi:hypothetical protein